MCMCEKENQVNVQLFLLIIILFPLPSMRQEKQYALHRLNASTRATPTLFTTSTGKYQGLTFNSNKASHPFSFPWTIFTDSDRFFKKWSESCISCDNNRQAPIETQHAHRTTNITPPVPALATLVPHRSRRCKCPSSTSMPSFTSEPETRHKQTES